MKSMQSVASSVAALFLLGMSASAWATEPEVKSEDTRPHVDEAVTDEASVTSLRDGVDCREFCPLREMPVYVPPSRDSAAHRIGGGTRGGGFRG